jgi:multidrug efflux pump subunit AcrB
MAFLGVASLIGVIVSHVIVLFDFIEEMHEKGEPLERALPDAGIGYSAERSAERSVFEE